MSWPVGRTFCRGLSAFCHHRRSAISPSSGLSNESQSNGLQEPDGAVLGAGALPFVAMALGSVTHFGLALGTLGRCRPLAESVDFALSLL